MFPLAVTEEENVAAPVVPIIDKGANIGLNAVLHQFANVGENCMIGASAFVKGDAKPNTKYAGVPAREIGSNIR